MFRLATVTACMLAAAVWAQTPARPEAYPDVPLGSKSVPHYTAVALDTEGTRVGYVLFDGNVDEGYGKMFVWVPGDPRYDKPKGFKSDDQREYPAFGVSSSTTLARDKEDVAIDWTMRWYIDSGKRTDRDYARGEMVARDVGRHPVFRFTADFKRTPKRTVVATAAASPEMMSIDIGIPGYIRTSTVWTNCPDPVLPWKNLEFYVTPEPLYERGKIFMQFKGRLSYHYWWPCRIGQISDKTEITLVVKPYLEPAVYSNKVNSMKLLGPGVLVELNPGWYDCDWNIKDVGLKIESREDRRKQVYPPYALPRPSR